MRYSKRTASSSLSFFLLVAIIALWAGGCGHNARVTKSISSTPTLIEVSKDPYSFTLSAPKSSELTEYRERIRKSPSDTELRREFSIRLRQNGDINGACAELRAALLVDSNEIETRSLLGDYLMHAKNYKEAAIHFKHLIRLRSDEEGDRKLIDKGFLADAYWNMSIIETQSGNSKRAKQHRSDAVKYAPEWMIREYHMLSDNTKSL